MTDRRSHWDIDLVTAVCSAVSPGLYLTSDQVFRIIAAVEDWHKAKRDSRVRTHSEGCWRWHNECAESLIEWQQAAIQRVRELHEFDGVHSCLGCSDNAPWPCDTIRALDGDSDD